MVGGGRDRKTAQTQRCDGENLRDANVMYIHSLFECVCVCVCVVSHVL